MYAQYPAISIIPCILLNFLLMIVGTTAMITAPRQATISMLTELVATARGIPYFLSDTSEHTGSISVRSIMLAPSMLPADRDASFFFNAVIVVTSSGREVPMATAITLITLWEMPKSSASIVPEFTNRLAPITIPAPPDTNIAVCVQ